MENKKSTSLTNNKCCGNGNFNEIHVCEKQPSSDSYREDSKTAPSYVRVASASSSEFDEERAKIAAIDYVGQTDLESEDHFLFKLGFFRGARYQHAKDAEEIISWREKNLGLVLEREKLTEENQRLRSCFLDTEESNADMYSKCKKAEERIEKLTAALSLAVNIADGWIHDQLDGTSILDEALKELAPAKEALAADSGGAE